METITTTTASSNYTISGTGSGSTAAKYIWSTDESWTPGNLKKWTHLPVKDAIFYYDEKPINRIIHKGKDITDSMRDILRWIDSHQDYLDSQKPISRPPDPIKKVYFNYKKGATTVLWKDGETTTVRCQGGEPFDEEKGIAMCFVKKFFDNRGCYNEIFKKWLVDAELQGKIFHDEDRQKLIID